MIEILSAVSLFPNLRRLQIPLPHLTSIQPTPLTSSNTIREVQLHRRATRRNRVPNLQPKTRKRIIAYTERTDIKLTESCLSLARHCTSNVIRILVAERGILAGGNDVDRREPDGFVVGVIVGVGF
jgi:hypothetical protein